jgi:hypothetical protein
MEWTNQLPTVSRGYILARDFLSTLGRRPTEDEYEALRQWINDTAAVDRADGAKPTLPSLQPLLNTPRDILGRPFDPTRESYAEAVNATYGAMMRGVRGAARQGLRVRAGPADLPAGHALGAAHARAHRPGPGGLALQEDRGARGLQRQRPALSRREPVGQAGARGLPHRPAHPVWQRARLHRERAVRAVHAARRAHAPRGVPAPRGPCDGPHQRAAGPGSTSTGRTPTAVCWPARSASSEHARRAGTAGRAVRPLAPGHRGRRRLLPLGLHRREDRARAGAWARGASQRRSPRTACA